MPSVVPHQIYTIGVEEEYQIIDPITRDLSSSAIPLLQEAHQLLGESVQHEMLLSQIEIFTPICRTLLDVREHLVRLRGGVITAAGRIDKQIAAAGTHPFALWQDQHLSPGERYHSPSCKREQGQRGSGKSINKEADYKMLSISLSRRPQKGYTRLPACLFC